MTDVPALPCLEEIRKARGLSLRALAARSNLAVSTVHRLERLSRHKPNKVTVLALAEALGVEPEELTSSESSADVSEEAA